MRWIAASLLAVSMALAMGFLLANRFLVKHSDPNLAELGLSSDPAQVAAPDEPEPAASLPSGDVRPAVLFTPPAKLDPNLVPATYMDTAGAANLDNTAYRWMPLCRDGAVTDPGNNRSSDHMPRCDDSSLKSLLQNKANSR